MAHDEAVAGERVAQRHAERRVLVVGGAAGIGRAGALRMAAEGATVAIADRDGSGAAATARAINGSGGTALGRAMDVIDEASVRDGVAEVVAAMGGLDAAVITVGIVDGGAVHDLTLEQWELVLRVNLTGTFLVLKHAIPELVQSGGGAIVTTGSVASVVAAGAAASYDASKGGVLQLTRSVARSYADAGVRANCLCPGAVRTDIFANSTDVLGHEPPRGGMTVTPPISRAAHPDEIAGVISFLVSDDSSFMTGSAVMADGGFTAI